MVYIQCNAPFQLAKPCEQAARVENNELVSVWFNCCVRHKTSQNLTMGGVRAKPLSKAAAQPARHRRATKTVHISP